MVATNDIGAEVATLLTGPAWSGQRVVELGSMVTADEVAEQLGEVLNLDVKAFAVPRAGWAEAFEQFGIPKGHTGPAEEMFEAVNAGWMDLGVEGTEHVAGIRTRGIRDCTERRQGVSPGLIRQLAAQFCGAECRLMAHRDNSLRCGFWSLSGPNSGLWPAERPEDLWVHGIVSKDRFALCLLR